MRRWFAIALAAALTALIASSLVGRSQKNAASPRMSVLDALGAGADDARFARATEPRDFHFPADHGAHPEFRNEWWYWTGNLEGPKGERFGYQFTIFRSALAAAPVERDSAWAATQVYMAHFAVSDGVGGTFRAFERTSRAALDLAGAEASPFRVWVLDWSAVATDARPSGSSPADVFAVRIRAQNEGTSVDLVLQQGKPVAVHGDRGLSRKGSEPGNASYYYSLTRMPTTGTLAVDGRVWNVRGDSWMDREWSTSALEPDQAGWDWLSLQLDDRSELMFFRLRRKDGTTDPMSAGSFVDPSGSVHPLRAGDVDFGVSSTWRSPRSGGVYPSTIHLAVRGPDLDLSMTPLLADQELDLSFRYWEGAMRVGGRAAGAAVTGRGYLELTGYGENQARAR